jgi:hypothetical protein
LAGCDNAEPELAGCPYPNWESSVYIQIVASTELYAALPEVQVSPVSAKSFCTGGYVWQQDL